MELNDIILARSPYIIPNYNNFINDEKKRQDIINKVRNVEIYLYIGTGNVGKDFISILSIKENAAHKLSKPRITNDLPFFNVSNYLKDYLKPSINPLFDNSSNVVNGEMKDTCWFYYDAYLFDSQGEFLDKLAEPIRLAVYGYDYFQNGVNPKPTSGIFTEGRSFCIPQNGIFKTAAADILNTGRQNTNDAVKYYKNHPEVKVNTEVERKYTPFQVAFINRFGFFQVLSFPKASSKRMNTTRESYRRVLFSNGSYNTLSHHIKDYEISGQETITLNTDIIYNESDNEIIKQFILSDTHYLIENGKPYPVRLATPNIEFKTLTKNKIIQYSFDFEFSNNVINDII